jgi:hypothetical protein
MGEGTVLSIEIYFTNYLRNNKMCQGAIASYLSWPGGELLLSGVGGHHDLIKSNKDKLLALGWRGDMTDVKVYSIESDFSGWNKFTFESEVPPERIKKILADEYERIAGSAEALITHVKKVGKIDEALVDLLVGGIPEVDKVRAELDRARAERDKADAERDKVWAEWDKARAEWDRARAEWGKVWAEWYKARAEWYKARAELDKVWAEWDKARAELDRARAEYDKARDEWGKAGAEYDKARDERDKARAEWDKARGYVTVEQWLAAFAAPENRVERLR